MLRYRVAVLSGSGDLKEDQGMGRNAFADAARNTATAFLMTIDDNLRGIFK